jgi:Ca2+/Na+ antiporter
MSSRIYIYIDIQIYIYVYIYIYIYTYILYINIAYKRPKEEASVLSDQSETQLAKFTEPLLALAQTLILRYKWAYICVRFMQHSMHIMHI